MAVLGHPRSACLQHQNRFSAVQVLCKSWSPTLQLKGKREDDCARTCVVVNFFVEIVVVLDLLLVVVPVVLLVVLLFVSVFV